MRFRGKQQRIRCSRRRRVRSALLPIALVLCACGNDASDSISLLPLTFGAGTVRVRVAVESGYVEGSLEVSLDQERISEVFEFAGGTATAEVPIADGEHQLSVRARFRSAGRTSRGARQVRFAPPPALPELVASNPAAAAATVPVTAWFRLEFARPTNARARRSFELHCGGAVIPVAVHAQTPEKLIVTPAR
ncbi:MAG: hypothetical protein JRE13_00875, partial [Deltaproteobacteria bacterium]|nr:hypothetical protein [Deltaproteobacteria bacterium]